MYCGPGAFHISSHSGLTALSAWSPTEQCSRTSPLFCAYFLKPSPFGPGNELHQHVSHLTYIRRNSFAACQSASHAPAGWWFTEIPSTTRCSSRSCSVCCQPCACPHPRRGQTLISHSVAQVTQAPVPALAHPWQAVSNSRMQPAAAVVQQTQAE